MTRRISLVVAACTLCLMMAACSGEQAQMDKNDVKNFKGGPMPAGTWDKIAKQREEFARKHGGGAASGPPATPSGK